MPDTQTPDMNNPAESFEFGVTAASILPQKHTNMITYTEEAIMKYRAVNIDALLNDTSKLIAMIKHHHDNQVPRIDVLESYYIGNNPAIMYGKRRQEQEKSDHRIRHNFAGIISDFINSYVLSNPVKVIDTDAKPNPVDKSQMLESAFMETIYEFGKANDIDQHNLEIGKDQNNVGRAYELLQRTEDDTDKIYRLDPREVFMIHDMTVRGRVIAACRYIRTEQERNDLQREKYIVELYTHDAIHRYKETTLMNAQRLEIDGQPEPHMFGGVPIVEYRSDRYRMSVFERQLSLIDAYDAAQSDTANYMTDLNDAILVIEGRAENAKDPKMMKTMKDANMLILLPEQQYDGRESPLKAYYLTKSYDVQGVEAYKTRLRDDIFNLASVPNLSDETFAGNQSGEALKYKMFGLQQRRNDKEKFFAKGLRVRYALLANLKKEVSEYTGELPDIDFIFTPNLPESNLAEMETYINAGGTLSQKTMLKLLTFIDDPNEEIKKIKEEGTTTQVENVLADSWGLTLNG